jgi:hypothetical protein
VNKGISVSDPMKPILFLSAGFASIVAPQSPVPEGATVETIASGFWCVEGPVRKDGNGLLFAGIPANEVHHAY